MRLFLPLEQQRSAIHVCGLLRQDQIAISAVDRSRGHHQQYSGYCLTLDGKRWLEREDRLVRVEMSPSKPKYRYYVLDTKRKKIRKALVNANSDD